jgi:hypothetical protein
MQIFVLTLSQPPSRQRSAALRALYMNAGVRNL